MNVIGSLTTAATWRQWIADYAQLIKLRLTSLVVFTTVLGLLIAAYPDVSWTVVAMLAAGSFLSVGAANALNQVIERARDRKMIRTQNRPVADGRISVGAALAVVMVSTIAGVGILHQFIHPAAAWLCALGIIVYGFFYTPLKTVHPIAVAIGGIAGALPPLAGYVSVTGDFTYEAGVLFAMQFFWQFPHFWGLAWLLNDDYQRGGFRLMPYNRTDRRTAAIIFGCTAPLLIVAAGFYHFPWIGMVGTLLIAAISTYVVYKAYRLYRHPSAEHARNLMLASYLYLPVVLLIVIIEKMI